MATRAQTTEPIRALRGAGGLRGVRARQSARGAGTRASSGRGPTARTRWERPSELPRALDRVEALRFNGLSCTLAARLFGPSAHGALPCIVAWGSGGVTLRELRADEAWARALSDLTGAVVVLCGYRRIDPEASEIDAALAYAELIARADQLGIDSSQIAVTGRGVGFRVAANLAAESQGWPTLPTPQRCVAATPVPAAAAALREALGLTTPQPAPQGVRAGAEVFTRDGVRLGRIEAVRDGDVIVRRSLALDELAVPVRHLHAAQGAVRVDLRAAAIPLQDWGRSATDLTPAYRPSDN